MTDKKYDVVVFIGRFNPPHKAHIEIMEYASTISDRVVVIIGSAGKNSAENNRTLKNPFTEMERGGMISNAVSDKCFKKLYTYYNYDTPEDDIAWAGRIKYYVDKHTDSKSKVTLIGHAKDKSSEYLKWFPEWDSINVDSLYDLNATDIRNLYFSENFDPFDIINDVPISTYNFMMEFRNTQDFQDLLKQN